MSYRGDRFNKRMLSTNLAENTIDPTKNRHLSDFSLGVERLLRALDYDDAREVDDWRAEIGQKQASAVGAILRLVWSEKLHLVRPLLLIFEHRDNLEATLKKIKRSTYFRVRNQLLDFFVGL